MISVGKRHTALIYEKETMHRELTVFFLQFVGAIFQVSPMHLYARDIMPAQGVGEIGV